MADYVVRTQDDLAKWWFIEAGSGDRFSDLMDDEPSGPEIRFDENGWSGPDGNGEYTRTVTTKPDTVDENGTERSEGTVGTLTTTEWGHSSTTLYVGWDPTTANDTVDCHYKWDGSGAGPAWMTETVVDAIYLFHVNLEVGDGSTATSITAKNEHLYFDDDVTMEVKANATFNMGESSGDYGINGSSMNIGPTSALMGIQQSENSNINLYDSRIYNRGTQYVSFSAGDAVWRLSTLAGNFDVSADNLNRFRVHNTMTSLAVQRVNVVNLKTNVINISPIPFDDYFSHKMDTGFHSGQSGTKTVTGTRITNYITDECYQFGGSGITGVVKFVDPAAAITKMTQQGAGDLTFQEIYTMNFTVTDLIGVELAQVIVTADYSHLVEGSDSKTYKSTTTHTSCVLAQGTITMAGVAVADETFVIDSQTFTWKASRGGTGEVTIGADAPAAVTNIVTAINTDLTTVTAVDNTGDTVTVTAVTGGTAGNSLTFTESSTNMTVDGAGTLGTTTSGSGDADDGKPPTEDGNSNWTLYDASGGAGGTWDDGFAYKFEAEAFADETTGAQGNITEQDIIYKQWIGVHNLPDILELRIHKMAYSKAGYATMIWDNLILNEKTRWHIQMVPERGPFAVGAFR